MHAAHLHDLRAAEVGWACCFTQFWPACQNLNACTPHFHHRPLFESTEPMSARLIQLVWLIIIQSIFSYTALRIVYKVCLQWSPSVKEARLQAAGFMGKALSPDSSV